MSSELRCISPGLRAFGAVLFGLTGLALAGVGTFSAGHPLHVPISAAFFVGLTLTLWTYGAGDVRAGAVRRGTVALALGTANPLAWLGWWLFARDALGPAVPEAVGAVAFGMWTAGTAVWLTRARSAA